MTTRPLLGIGAFSRLAHLSTHALRHYHDVGLLEPAEVDDRTGYRRYDPAQADVAHLIRRLRALDMPLDAVAEVVRAPDPDARDRLIAGHLAHMEAELDRTRRAVASLRLLLGADPALPAVEVRHLAATSALACSAPMGRDDIAAWCQATYPRLHGALADAGGEPTGPPGGLYPEEWFADDAGEVTAYLPCDLAADVAADGLEVLDLPAVDVAVLVHVGDHAELDRSYGALGRHVAEAGLDAPGPIRERYLIGPDTTLDPTRWRTEICWPVHP